MEEIKHIVIGLFNTGGYGVGYGETKKRAIDHILNRIEKEKHRCHVIQFVQYPFRVLDRADLTKLEIYANALTGSRVSQFFLRFIA